MAVPDATSGLAPGAMVGRVVMIIATEVAGAAATAGLECLLFSIPTATPAVIRTATPATIATTGMARLPAGAPGTGEPEAPGLGAGVAL